MDFFKRISFQGVVLVLFILLLGIFFTWYFMDRFEQAIYYRGKEKFSLAVQEINSSLNEEFQKYQIVLTGCKGFVEGSDEVERNEWKTYTALFLSQSSFPGLQGLGLIWYVRESEKQNFLSWAEKARRELFQIWPSGTRDFYCPVLYIEPEDTNKKMIGFDLCSEEERKNTIIKAIETGTFALSNSVRLVLPEKAQLHAFIYMLPIYKKGANISTSAQRQQSIQAFTEVVIILEELLNQTLKNVSLGVIDLKVYEQGNEGAENLVYTTFEEESSLKESYHPLYHERMSFSLGGQNWVLEFSSTAHFDQTISASSRWQAILIGVLLTLLLEALVFSLLLTRYRASHIAVDMNREISDTLARMKAILDGSSYSIIATNREGLIMVFNKAAERMLGYAADEVIGKKTPESFHDKQEMIDRAALITKDLGIYVSPSFEVFVAYAKLNKADENEWTYIRKDSSRFPVNLCVTGIKNAEGSIIGFVGIAYDLTEKKMLEQAKNEFIAITSHELRSPLTAIKGSLDLALAKFSLPQPVLDMLNIAKQNCERLLLLSKDLLDMQKVELGIMQLDLQLYNLVSVIKEGVETFLPQMKESGIEITWRSESNEIMLLVDKFRIIQVLTNLLSNATKHSAKGQKIEVVITPAADNVKVEVKDQGPGISEEEQPKVFQKFFRSSSEAKMKGTGLGLTVAKSIIELHNGKIGFVSSPQGTTFWFQLPLSKKIASE